jgi:hypothetical protein
MEKINYKEFFLCIKQKTLPQLLPVFQFHDNLVPIGERKARQLFLKIVLILLMCY